MLLVITSFNVFIERGNIFGLHKHVNYLLDNRCTYFVWKFRCLLSNECFNIFSFLVLPNHNHSLGKSNFMCYTWCISLFVIYVLHAADPKFLTRMLSSKSIVRIQKQNITVIFTPRVYKILLNTWYLLFSLSDNP